jgi:hypothetical protein
MKRWSLVLGVLAALGARPALAQEMVTCKDGSSAKAGKGACSHHGGVAKVAPAAPAPTNAPPPRNDNAPPPASTQRSSPPPAPSRSTQTGGATGKPTAQCKDGTTSYSAHHSGACSHHGGVKQWLDGTQ